MLNEGILDFAVNNLPCKTLTLCGVNTPAASGRLDVPQHVSIDGEQWTVTRVAPRSFVNCKWLTSISLPNSVTEIGRQAFANCTSLVQAVLPSRLTVINAMTFAYCTSLTSVNIADSVTEICEGAFTGCTNLSDVVLPSAIKSIRKDAFSSCAKLTTINLPDGVQNVDAKAFYDTGLTSVSVPPSVSHIGVLKIMLLPARVQGQCPQHKVLRHRRRPLQRHQENPHTLSCRPHSLHLRNPRRHAHHRDGSFLPMP